MARRRAYDDINNFDDNGEPDLIKSPGGEPPPDGSLIEPNPDESGPEGDTTRGREMWADDQPNVPMFRPPKQPPMGPPDQGQPPTPTQGLPEGMTVQDQGGYGDMGGADDSYSTPLMPHEPQVTRRIAAPALPHVSSPASQSALFSDASGGTPLFGRMGGLTGGGIGVPGSNEGGPTPTQMMLSLLRMFRNWA
jgi:hypothetical protein